MFYIDDNSIIKALFGTAGRRPSGYEEYSSIYLEHKAYPNVVTRWLDFEESKSYELLYIFRNNKNIISNFSLFYNTLNNIIYEDDLPEDRFRLDAEYPYYFVNGDATIHNYGLSVSFKYKTDFGLEFMLGNVLSFVDINSDNDALLFAVKSDSPRNIFRFLLSYELINDFSINLFGVYETKRETLDGVNLYPIQNIDVSITYHPHRRTVSTSKLSVLDNFYLALSLKNILNTKNFYSVSSDSFKLIPTFPVDNGFSVGIHIGYTF